MSVRFVQLIRNMFLSDRNVKNEKNALFGAKIPRLFTDIKK